MSEDLVGVEEEVAVEHTSEPRSSAEMLRFFVLVIILGVTVLVVAVSRPLIFGKIVPAVMGEGIVIPTDVPVVEEVEEAVEEETAVDDSSTEEEAAPAEETVVEEVVEEETATSPDLGADSTTEEPTDEEEREEAAAGLETADKQTHRIRQGETLQTIAAQYGVTMQALIETNKLTNPDLIKIGDELLIPQAVQQP